MSEQEGRLGYQDFYAICNHNSDEDRVLRIGGTVIAPNPGWTAELEEYRGLPPVVQTLFKVKLVVTESNGNVPQVITPIELPEYRVENPVLEYSQVEFVFEGPDDIEGPGAIEVEHPV
jgi:hypothetical protein